MGEAAYGPAASSLVADYFPGDRRAMAMGILASGVALGGVLGLLLGGHLEASYGWRVAFMTVGVPGFICAMLVARLQEPSRMPTELTVRSFFRNFQVGVSGLLRALWPLVAASVIGGVVAWWLDRYYGADSRLDVATMSAAVGLGLALTIVRWVRRTQDAGEASDFDGRDLAAPSTTSSARAARCFTLRRWSTSFSRAR